MNFWIETIRSKERLTVFSCTWLTFYLDGSFFIIKELHVHPVDHFQRGREIFLFLLLSMMDISTPSYLFFKLKFWNHFLKQTVSLTFYHMGQRLPGWGFNPMTQQFGSHKYDS